MIRVPLFLHGVATGTLGGAAFGFASHEMPWASVLPAIVSVVMLAGALQQIVKGESV